MLGKYASPMDAMGKVNRFWLPATMSHQQMQVMDRPPRDLISDQQHFGNGDVKFFGPNKNPQT